MMARSQSPPSFAASLLFLLISHRPRYRQVRPWSSAGPSLAAALSAPSSSSCFSSGRFTNRATGTALAAAGTGTELPNSRRIFVGNLSPSCRDTDSLRETFRAFGDVAGVTLHGVWGGQEDGGARKRKGTNRSKVRPYAFVTFQKAESASRAIAEAPTQGHGALFGAVKAADPIKPRVQSNVRRLRTDERRRLAAFLSKEANVVLQGPKSHLERLGDYLTEDDAYDCQVLGTLDPGRRTVGLLFLRAADPAELAGELLTVPWAAIAVNKLYVVNGGNPVGGTVGGAVSGEALRRLIALRDSELGDVTGDGKGIVVRIQAFPPSIRPGLIAAMDGAWDEDKLAGVDIRPTGFTHTVSVVELEPPGEGYESDGGGRYVLGLSAALPTDAVSTHDRARFHEDGSAGVEEDVCRAYYKLQEMLERYRQRGVRSSSSSSSSSAPFAAVRDRLSGSVALDCGAAPGGWTSFLLDSGCRTVHSVDPGELSESVRDMEGVRHWKMRVEEALPALAAENVRLDVWASDMCLHVMAEQLDWLLRAKEAGILSPDAMFVLTMKCNIGHSRSSYDAQVEREVGRLKEVATGVKMMHLFSNRSGERTVMGFLS